MALADVASPFSVCRAHNKPPAPISIASATILSTSAREIFAPPGTTRPRNTPPLANASRTGPNGVSANTAPRS